MYTFIKFSNNIFRFIEKCNNCGKIGQKPLQQWKKKAQVVKFLSNDFRLTGNTVTVTKSAHAKTIMSKWHSILENLQTTSFDSHKNEITVAKLGKCQNGCQNRTT